MNKTIRRIGAMLLAVMTALTVAVSASAATVPEAVIDTGRTGSIDIYKYDLSLANTDDSVKALLDSYVSTGVRDESLEAALDDGSANDLGNGQTSYGYAIKGVEFSYLKVADIMTYDETEADGTHRDTVLYRMEDTASAGLLSALGLSPADAYAVTDGYAQAGYHFYESDTLADALKSALGTNSTAVKNALETYMAAGNASKFDETDEHGHTKKTDLALGLYLIVETKVPELVTYTTDPFLVSVPMTAVSGTNADNGGEEWLYDITLYPKNETGIPSLEKTVREALKDTGKNGGTDAIDDGYAHNATASCGDAVEYQIISRLPAITSEATALTDYTFVDTLGRGIEYNANAAASDVTRINYDPEDVVIEWYRDEACTDKITEWKLSDAEPKYTVSFEPPSFVHSPALEHLTNDATRMTVAMTAAGLDEINHGTAAREGSGHVEQGYSSCWMRITYSATVNQNGDTVFGDDGNPNTVILTWKRSNMNCWDTLVDDCHVYTYVLDLTKEFSDGAGDFTKVSFRLFNATDGYWVTGIDVDGGQYYVLGKDESAGHVTGTADEDGSKGTAFVPNQLTGRLTICGLEDDEYIITETQTDNGYTLLKDGIRILITAGDDEDRPCGIYGTDVLGLLQNDPRYETFDGYRELAHNMLTATAKVDGDDVSMEPDRGSENAAVPLTVVNTKGFDLPRTGDSGVWQYGVFGAVLMAAAAAAVIALIRSGKKKQKTK